jgi:ribosomal RNA-processing protein 8
MFVGQGYQLQAKSWPLDPLDTIIAALLHLPPTHVVADMGCGQARLATSIPNTVHSFDIGTYNSSERYT